jgi:hypothetical protein
MLTAKHPLRRAAVHSIQLREVRNRRTTRAANSQPQAFILEVCRWACCSTYHGHFQRVCHAERALHTRAAGVGGASSDWGSAARRLGCSVVILPLGSIGPQCRVSDGDVRGGDAAVEDEAVLGLLPERRVYYDVALTRNECLNVVSSVAEHSLHRILASGVPVTLSINDPLFFFATDLLREREYGLRLHSWMERSR